jgi:hypothetical protein
MTRRSIEEQVEILRTTTERVGVSRESASDFLRSAGIAHQNGAIQKRSSSPSTEARWAKRETATGKFVAKKSKK